jgi:hypothetical protein
MRTLIREGIVQCPLWRACEDTSHLESTWGHVNGVYLDVTHYGELTLVFLERVSFGSPHGSAMCDRHSPDHTPL